MQLVAYGAQDVYLTGNPQITLFKVVYRRHTNFAIECIELALDIAKPSGRPTIQILRNGDLASRSYLRIQIPDLVPGNATSDLSVGASGFNGKVAWVRRLGHALLRSVEIQIGGSSIDKHWGTWLDVWYELTHTDSQVRGYREMIGDTDALTRLQPASVGVSGQNKILFIPLQFWYCRNYGQALPLIALQYHEVRLNFEFAGLDHLVVYTRGTGTQTAPTFPSFSYTNASVLVDYVYLDSEERRRFAQVGHEYLIEQLQTPGESALVQQGGGTAPGSQNFLLNFNHPCKEFIWTHKLGAFNGTGGSSAGWFLAYSNRSEWMGGWDEAIREAANNLATAMIALQPTGTTPPGPPAPSQDPWTAIDKVVYSVVLSPTTDPLSTYTIPGTSTVFKFICVNTTGLTTQTQTVYILGNPITFGSINLASNILDITVELDYADQPFYAGTQPNGPNVTVSVAENNLSLVNLSLPLVPGGSTSVFTDRRLAMNTGNDIHVTQFNNYGLDLQGNGNLVLSGNLVFNGHDRFSIREGNYFNYVQPYQHHTHTPSDGINVYSFALHPEQHQPTGTANMSRIDTCRLVYRTQDVLRQNMTLYAPLNYTVDTVMWVFATNYNILRIMSGMGGLAYSN